MAPKEVPDTPKSKLTLFRKSHFFRHDFWIFDRSGVLQSLSKCHKSIPREILALDIPGGGRRIDFSAKKVENPSKSIKNPLSGRSRGLRKTIPICFP